LNADPMSDHEDTAGGARAVYDRAEALARLGGDEALFVEMAGLFAAESAGYCAALEDALATGDANALKREAHTAKSLFSTFSAEAGRELAWRLEELAASGCLDGAPALTAAVVAALGELSETLARERTPV
jgi:HPt (histidine-containing phosphotransfer) domain-containing protein